MFAKLVLPAKKKLELVVGVGLAAKDSELRPLTVHSAGLRICCASYVPAVRAAAVAMVSKDQSGFLRSTVHNIVDAEDRFMRATAGSKRGGGFASDVERAFPSIHHAYAAQFFLMSGAPAWVRSLFINIFRNIFHFFRHRSALRRGATVRRGVTQGNPLSAYFFIILYQLLVDLLQEQMIPGESAHSYADDVLLILVGVRRLLKILPCFYLFGRASGCRLNLSKSCWLAGRLPSDVER